MPPYIERIRRLSWRGFSFTLPLWWEITGHHFANDEGQFQFYERVRPRGQLVWRTVPQTPDQPRILDEVHRRFLAKAAPADASVFAALSTSVVGQFLFAWHRPGLPAYASLYQHSTRTLLQWIFPEHDEAFAASTLLPLLESFRPNHAWPRRHELFGVSLQLPEPFAFEAISPEPANVAITFETAKDLHLTARRIGLDRAVLAGLDLAGLHRRLLSRARSRVMSSQPVEFRGLRGVRTAFERRGERRMEMLTGAWWPGDAWMWHDPTEGRIYAIEQVGPPKHPRLEPDDVVG